MSIESNHMKKLIEFYQNYDEDGRLVKNRAKALEFLTTVEVLKTHLSGGRSLLDVGAGTGRYSVFYASQGMQVTAVEVVPEYAAIIRQKAKAKNMEHLHAFTEDARNLQRWDANSFDAVLCFGPLYHLRSRQERAACLAECVRVLRPGGIIALAYLNKWFAIAYYCKNEIYLERTMVEKILAEDYDFQSDVDAFLDISCFTAPDSIEHELSAYPLDILDHIGTDGIYALFGEALERMSEEEWKQWYAYHRSICREKSILGYSCHGLVICQKDVPSHGMSNCS